LQLQGRLLLFERIDGRRVFFGDGSDQLRLQIRMLAPIDAADVDDVTTPLPA
jgi:hypothetical protein